CQCGVFFHAGGEGCILAAAGSLIGIGSDIGGSIRVVPNDGQFPDAVGNRTNFLCTGPILKLDDPVSLQNIKFYSMEHDGGSIFLLPVAKEILQAHRKVVAHLETDLGIEVESVAIRKMKYSFQIWSAMMSSKSSNNQENQTFTDLLGDHGKPVWPSWELVKWMMRLSSHTFPAIALGITEKVTKYNSKASAKLASMAQSLQAEVVELLGENGVLLYPSHPVLAPKHHMPLGMPFNFAYTAIFNILGLPVTQCPLGLSKDGLPLGIQVVAGPHNDHLTLAMAQYLEKAFGGWVPPDFNLVDNTMSFVPDDVPSIGLRQPRNMNSAHSVLEEETNQIQKGGKEPSQDDSPSNLLQDFS
ncbi:Fatty-acid amide hydrolase 2, partial [Ophiophagus hannah]